MRQSFSPRISAILAALSWRYIEQPFRGQKAWLSSRRLVFQSSLAGLSIFILVGAAGHFSRGYETRYNPDTRKLLALLYSSEEQKDYVRARFRDLQGREWQDNNKIKLIIIGDSYAQDLVNALYEVNLHAGFDITTHYIGKRCGNLFVPKDVILRQLNMKDRTLCSRRESLLESPELMKKIKSADQIWLASSWEHWHLEFLPQTLEKLRELSDSKVLLFGRKDFPQITRQKYLNLAPKERAELVAQISQKKLSLQLQMKEMIPQDAYVDTQSAVCEDISRNCKPFDPTGMPKTFDGSHLTKFGAVILGNNLAGRLPYLRG